MRFAITLICILSIALNGCAYMFNGGTQNVSFEAHPQTADIKINGRYIGTGSAVASLDRGSSYNVVASAPGHKDSGVYLNKKTNAAWVTWDVVSCVFMFALCIPLIADASSGAWNGFDDHYQVKLSEDNISNINSTPQVTVQPTPSQQIIVVK